MLNSSMKKRNRMITMIGILAMSMMSMTTSSFAFTAKETLLDNQWFQMIESKVGMEMEIILVAASTLIITLIAIFCAICLYRVTKEDEYEEEFEFSDFVEREKLETEQEPLDRGKTIDLFFQQQEEIEKERQRKNRGKHF